MAADVEVLLHEVERIEPHIGRQLVAALWALLSGQKHVRLDDASARRLAWVLYGLQLSEGLSATLESLRVETFRYVRERGLHDDLDPEPQCSRKDSLVFGLVPEILRALGLM